MPPVEAIPEQGTQEINNSLTNSEVRRTIKRISKITNVSSQIRGNSKKKISTHLAENPLSPLLTHGSNSDSEFNNSSKTSEEKTKGKKISRKKSNGNFPTEIQEPVLLPLHGNTEVISDFTLKLKDFDLDKAKAELCKRDLFYFIKEFWSTVVTKEPVYNWHIEFLCRELQEIGLKVINREKKDNDVIINLPPGATKSSIISIMFPAWLWCIDPTLRIISGCYAATLANEQSTKSRTIIESPKYKTYFPLVRIKEDQNVKSNYQTTAGGARYTTSTGGSITGFHADVIIVDDPQNPELANSQTERERTNTWVSETLSGRKTDREVTVTFIVQQRLHPMDVTGYLLSRGKPYKHICLPAELNKALQPLELADKYIDGLLDINRLNRTVLAESRLDLGAKGYNTQMLQQPQNDEDSIIRESWLPIISKEDFQTVLLNYKEKEKKEAVFDFYADTAYTDKTKNDPSALLSCTRINQTLYITNVAQVWLEFPKLIEFIKSFTQANGFNYSSKIFIEPKASGKSIVQELKSKTGLNVQEAANPTKDKIQRLISISPTIERGDRVVLVKGSYLPLFLSEITATQPLHDDMRDTFVMAVQDKLIKSKNYGRYSVR